MCLCDEISSAISRLLYFGEKFAMCCAGVSMVSCLVATLTIMLMLGIGLGYNYCYIDAETISKNFNDAETTRQNYNEAGSTSENYNDAGTTSENYNDAGTTSENYNDAGTTSENYNDAGTTSENYNDARTTSENYNDVGTTSENAGSTESSSSLASFLRQNLLYSSTYSTLSTISNTFSTNTASKDPFRKFLYLDKVKRKEYTRMASQHFEITSTDTVYQKESSAKAATLDVLKNYKYSVFPPSTRLPTTTKVSTTTVANGKNSTVTNDRFYRNVDTADPFLAKETLSTEEKLNNENYKENKVGTEKIKHNNKLFINGLDLIALLAELRAENRNYSLQIITS